MKHAIALAAALTAATGGIHAAETYDDYDVFYADQPGAVFGDPIKHQADIAYSAPEERGVHAEWQTKLNGRTVSVSLASDRVTVNGRTFRYANATAFPDESATDFPPQGADVFIAERTRDRPALLCLQGDGVGSGESDRYKQVYLLIDPLAPNGNATFLHLPSLLASCRAVSTTTDGKLIFPRNIYRLDDAQASRVGLLVSYYTFENQRFVSVPRKIELQFTNRNVPFRFAVTHKE